MFKRLLQVGAVVAGLLSMSAQAAFVATDWKNAGDSLATLHVETGKEWLDLSRTDGLSVNAVLSQLGEGGTFAGWRLPRYDEVIDLMRSYTGFDFSETLTTVSSGASATMAMSFINLFGQTHFAGESSNGNWYGYGYHLNESGTLVYSGTRHSNSFGNRVGVSYAGSSLSTSHTVDLGSAAIGVFLVSDGGVTLSSLQDPMLNINNPDAPVNLADVPAPAGVLLAGLALLMLRNRRRA